MSLEVWCVIVGLMGCDNVEDTDSVGVTEAKLVGEVGFGSRLVGTSPVAVEMKVNLSGP